MVETIPNPAVKNEVAGVNAPSLIPNHFFIIPAICKKRMAVDPNTARIYMVMGKEFSIRNMVRAGLQKYEAQLLPFDKKIPREVTPH